MRQSVLRWLSVAAVVALVGATSCRLISGTEAFEIFLGDLTASGGTFNRTLVDLEDNSIYEDHQDNIQAIDRIGWTCRVVNTGNTNADVSVFASADGDLSVAEVESLAIPVFTAFTVGAGANRVITYDQSLELLSEQSFRDLQTLVLNGNFTLYSTSSAGFDMLIEDLNLLITFTVGL